MKRAFRERTNAIRDVMLEFHGASVDFEQVNGTHWGAVLSYRNEKRRVVFSTSTSDKRATANVLSCVRRTLRSMGVSHENR